MIDMDDKNRDTINLIADGGIKFFSNKGYLKLKQIDDLKYMLNLKLGHILMTPELKNDPKAKDRYIHNTVISRLKEITRLLENINCSGYDAQITMDNV